MPIKFFRAWHASKIKPWSVCTTALLLSASLLAVPALAHNQNADRLLPPISLLLLDDAPEPTQLRVDQELVDDAMELPVPRTEAEYISGRFTGRNSPAALFLTLLGRDNPQLESSDGVNIQQRAVAHLHALLNTYNPTLVGGHASWQNMFYPITLGIARRTPSMWRQFSKAERTRATLIMQHALYTANIFLNTNSQAKNASLVFADMLLQGTGSLPNQSAAFHAYGIGSFLFFGGTERINTVLADYNLKQFQTQLRAVGYNDMADIYDNPDLQRLLNGERISTRAYPDPLGVRKPLLEINTLSLNGSKAGTEHPYFSSSPLPATPPRIFQRWGHEFAVGATIKSNVGPDLNNKCSGIDLGLASGVLPDENKSKGMPYEFNARSTVDGPHTRSSWDYSSWGMQQYMYLFAAVTMSGYWDMQDERDKAIWKRAKKAVQIYRIIGEKKWVSSGGPQEQICTSNHSDAYWVYGGAHWAQGLMEAILFDPKFVPPKTSLTTE